MFIFANPPLHVRKSAIGGTFSLLLASNVENAQCRWALNALFVQVAEQGGSCVRVCVCVCVRARVRARASARISKTTNLLFIHGCSFVVIVNKFQLL